VRPESRHVTRVMSSDQSQAYDQGRIFQSESGIRSKSHPVTGVGHTIRVTSSQWSWAYDQSRIFQSELGI
jgi:hypothetical protein